MLETIISIAISVALVCALIGIFFFTYAKTVEKEIVLNNVKFTVDDLIGNIIGFLNPNEKNILKKLYDNVHLDVNKAADEEVEKSNEELTMKAIKYMGGFVVMTIILSYVAASTNNINFQHIMEKNLILLFFIFIAEFSFLTFCAKKFISANPYDVKYNIIKKLI